MKIGGIALIVIGAILLIENTDSFPFAIALFIAGIVLIAYAFHKEKDYQKQKIEQKTFTKPQQIEITKTLLVEYYLDLGEESAKETNQENIFNNKRDLIRLKIQKLIKKQEEIHGTIFLTEDTDTNQEARDINSDIGKHCFAIIFFFLAGLENTFPNVPFDDVIQGIVDLMDENAKNTTFDDNSVMQDLIFNDYFADMIKTKIEERQGT